VTFPQYIASHLAKPFAWGQHDCVLFVAGWLKLSTGVDHLAGIKPWSTEAGAMRMVARRGGFEKILDGRLTKIAPAMATDGCVALCDGRLHLFTGSKIVGPGSNGLVFINRMKAECAWSY
jgi:hypothetical protein